MGDAPGGPVVKNPLANGGHSGLGTKIPHATGQLSLCTKTPRRCNEDPGQPKIIGSFLKVVGTSLKDPGATD